MSGQPRAVYVAFCPSCGGTVEVVPAVGSIDELEPSRPHPAPREARERLGIAPGEAPVCWAEWRWVRYVIAPECRT